MIYRTPLLLFFSISLGSIYYPSKVQAQLIPDRTLGTENSLVTPQALQDLIEGGAIRDSNLFHSFLEFNVNEGQNVTFANPAGILNILTRVTGVNPSDIFGTLGVDGGANLILINPNGINFGANASLDVSGSFFATTADSVVFDNFTFSTINPTAPPLIAINIPLGLQYGANPGNIEVQSANLSVGENLALLGGDISVDGATLEAPGGRVDLGGLSTTGTINFNDDGSLTFPDTGLADVSLTNLATVNVRDVDGGDIAVNANNFNLANSSLTAGINGSLNTGDAAAGDININATGAVNIAASDISNNVVTGAVGDSGDIQIQADSLSISNNSSLDAGVAGSITIDAPNLVTISNSTIASDGQEGQILIGQSELITPVRVILEDSVLTATNFGSGEAGNINISATEDIFITNNSIISSDAVGEMDIGEAVAGSITIDAPNLVEIIDSKITSESDNSGGGSFGEISILANQGSINIEHSEISTTNFDVAFAGDVLINAQEQISISNKSEIESNGEFGRIFIGNQLAPRTIIINDSSLTTTNDSQSELALEMDLDAGILEITAVESISINDSELSALTARTGNAGTITLETVNSNGQILLSNSNIISTVQESAVGDGGSIEINTGSLLATAQSLIDAATFGEGDAGFVEITTQNLARFEEASQVFSSVEPDAIGDAGGINITSDSLVVTESSTISTETLGDGDAGSVDIQAASVSIREGSNISSEASSDGDAGTVTINADEFSIESNAEATVSSQAGLAGDLIINARNLTLDEGRLTAFTTGGGANIELTVSNLMLLRNESLISATASEQANGGNVTIDARFIIAEPATGESGSNIAANAIAGNGGLVTIATDGLFGIAFQNTNTPFNDITASSETGAAGIVEILQPNVDPAQSLAILPVDLIDRSNSVVKSCGGGEESISRFIVTGRGGLPANPGEILRSTNILVDLVELEPETQETRDGETWRRDDGERIVEAQGWIVNAEGKILLTAQTQTSNFSSTASYCLKK